MPVKSAKTPAQRKAKAPTSDSSELTAGKRDPFKLPETSIARGGDREHFGIRTPGGVLPPGKRGLLISHLVLEGVVREQTTNKMIAVVTNETKSGPFPV